MPCRLLQVVLGAALLASSALAAVPAASAAGSWKVAAARQFSPNGDGTKDTLSVRYRVPFEAHVYLAIRRQGESWKAVRTVDLGTQAAGTHEWTWDGRGTSGTRVGDQRYVIGVCDSVPGNEAARASTRVEVDTVLQAVLHAPTYGDELGAPARVFPRTTVVTDTLDLTAYSPEDKLASLELVIRNSRGGVVRRAEVAEPLMSAPNIGVHGQVHGRTVAWAAVRGGKPLPSGRYTAVVRGRDKAGNSGSSETVRIWVSADKLEWQESTVTVAPADSLVGPCTWDGSSGCGDYTYCGHVVDSSLFPGGLSYRSAECTPSPGSIQTQPLAVAAHMLEVPDATGVRGLDAVRVSFTGAPIVAGEPDVGTLGVYGAAVPGAASVVEGTSGQSAWVEEPRWGEGLAEDPIDGEPQRDPAVLWGFSTAGTDSVDVASFTVDVRYLAVRD